MGELNEKIYIRPIVQTTETIGFRYDTKLDEYVYEFPVYLCNGKPSIVCKLGIKEDTNEVWLNVCDVTGRTYPSYYVREYGNSKIIPIIDRNIEKELKRIGVVEMEEMK